MSSATQRPAGRPLRFAVVGCGVIGRQHARILNDLDDAELTVAVDVDERAAGHLTATFGGAPMAKLDDALTRDDVDAVAVCTPSGVHAQLAIAALQAGKHVVVEKPVDVSLEAAAELVAAEARSPGVATVISQHRFDPSSRAVHDALRNGTLGQVTSGVATLSWWRSQTYYDSGTWRATWDLDGGGAAMNQGIHTVDLLVWMMGRPVEVTAYTACLAHDIEVEDTAVAIVRFESGALGVIHATTAAYPGLTARLQVHGTRGSAIIDDDLLQYFHAESLGPGSQAPDYGAGPSSNQADLVLPGQQPGEDSTAGADPAALSNAHALQYADFLDAVRSGRPPQVTVGAATTTLAVVLALYRSAAEGRAVPVTAPHISPY